MSVPAVQADQISDLDCDGSSASVDDTSIQSKPKLENKIRQNVLALKNMARAKQVGQMDKLKQPCLANYPARDIQPEKRNLQHIIRRSMEQRR